MAWATIDRNVPVVDPKAGPVLSEAVRSKIRSFFARYDTKRAALLPGLHVVQRAIGYVSHQAMVELAELLEIYPSEVIDTVTFYTHFWTKPRGEKMVTVCRSITCELMGGREVVEAVKKHLGIEEHGTTPDGKYSLMTEECLAGCDHAPCLQINEKLHKRVQAADVARILAAAGNDELDVPRSTLFDAPAEMGSQEAAVDVGPDQADSKSSE